MNAGDFIDRILTAAGGAPPYEWTAVELPAGLQCRLTGAIWGVVPAASDGTHAIRVEVRDAAGTRRQSELPLPVRAFAAPPSGFSAVPGGFFLIGYHASQSREGWLRHLQTHGYPISPDVARQEWPPGKVHLDGFYMQESEVTNEEYAEFVGADSSAAPPGHWKDGRVPAGLEQHPVVNVSYEDAQAYCAWRTRQARDAGQPHVYRLPTHWHWEKAAKAPLAYAAEHPHGPARLYPWGDQWGGGNLRHLDDDKLATVPVQQYAGAASGFGVRDLAGNVSEWIDGGTVSDGRLWKHIRGASWLKPGQLFGLTFLSGTELVDPEVTRGDIGFRCVAELAADAGPKQALVLLGNDQFVDGEGRTQFIGRFHMARFAVSNAEFAEFRPDHEFDEGQRHRPATNVSHEDAVAFCRWKSNLAGRPFRLPVRAEWERAYRGCEGRRYAWGSDYSRYCCNSLESGWGGVVDVFALWQGATPEGVYHLCGNAFEWLAEGGAVGGSWLSNCEHFGAPPYQLSPGSQRGAPESDIGFRYVTH